MDFLTPKVAYASLDSFIANVNGSIINPLIQLLFAVAVAVFLYGVFQFMMNQTNEENKTTGKSHMLWGIIGLVLMIGVWTILNILLDTFNIRDIDPERGSVNLPDYTPPRGSFTK